MNWSLVDPPDAGLFVACALFTLFGLLVLARNLFVSWCRRRTYDADGGLGRSVANLLVLMLLPMPLGMGVATFLTIWRAQQ